MSSILISNRIELKHNISLLESRCLSQEKKVINSVVELYYELHPYNVLKNTALSLLKGGELKQDLKTYSLNSVINFILSKVLGKNESLKGFLSTFFLQHIMSNTISGNSGKIFSVLSSGWTWLKSSLLKKDYSTSTL